MKLLGILATLGGFLALGLRPSQAAACELRSLEGLCRGLRAMREELCARLCPLRELLETAAALTEGEARAFFRAAAEGMDALGERSFAEIWTDACRRALPSLSEPRRRELEAPGLSLGRAEIGDQLAALDRAQRLLEAALAQGRESLPAQRRLALALSAAAGIFLCLLIL